MIWVPTSTTEQGEVLLCLPPRSTVPLPLQTASC